MARDYFAEMYVAGLMADAGWNIYFPRRDKGFDFVATYFGSGSTLVRPIQVKGLYPTIDRSDKPAYGFQGLLTALHPDMVLAIVYFAPGSNTGTPQHIAYMPRSEIRSRQRPGEFRSVPAKLCSGVVSVRRDFTRFFDESGLEAASQAGWH